MASKDLLDTTKVSAIATLQTVAYLMASDSVSQAFEMLEKHKCTSAAVFDEENEAWAGVVDALDLTTFVCRLYFSQQQQQSPSSSKTAYDPAALALHFKRPVRDVIGFQNRAPFAPIGADEPLATLVNDYFKFGYHRLAVTEKQGSKLLGLVSQLDLVRWLRANAAAGVSGGASIMAKTLDELGLSRRDVISINENRPLVEAFETMLERRVQGLAVLDNDGRLVNNLSASDVKGITEKTFPLLDWPVSEFFRNSLLTRPPPVHVAGNATVAAVIDRICDNAVHRVFVCEPLGPRCTSVVTLTDIIALFQRPAEFGEAL